MLSIVQWTFKTVSTYKSWIYVYELENNSQLYGYFKMN